MIKGAFILMIAGLFNRVLGFGLRVILVRIIGDEGLGLFQMVFPIFVTFSIIITLGLPVAVSKFVSQETAQSNYQTALQIFKISAITIVITASFFTFLFISNADLIANKLLNDSRTYYILMAIAPALFFTSLASVLRGFFQGLRIMTPTALSQIIEQITRIVVTLVILSKLVDSSLKFKTMGIAAGVTSGEIVGFATLTVIFFYYLPQLKDDSTSNKISNIKLFKNLLKFGIPITIGRLVASLFYSVEAVTIPSKLQAVGYSVSEATALYGQLSGMVQQLIYLPTIMTIALNSNLIPAISESVAQNSTKVIQKRISEALRLTIYFGLLAAIILFLVPEEICNLIFNYPQAGRPLKILASTALFLYLAQILGGVLQGLGKPNMAMKNSVIALVIELGFIYSIVYLPHSLAFEFITAAIGFRYFVIAILNFSSIKKEIDLHLSLENLLLKPLLAGSLVFLILPISYQMAYYIWDSNLISLLTSISLSTLFYLGFLVLTNGITKEDLERVI